MVDVYRIGYWYWHSLKTSISVYLYLASYTSAAYLQTKIHATFTIILHGKIKDYNITTFTPKNYKV